MRIIQSARKHGISDEEMLSALAVPMREVRQPGGDRLLVIGATRSGRLLELVVADPEGDDPRLIHAMPLRSKFYDYL